MFSAKPARISKGHFRLTSGLHSDQYLQCALVLQHPAIAERFGRELADKLPKAGTVASPAIGALPSVMKSHARRVRDSFSPSAMLPAR